MSGGRKAVSRKLIMMFQSRMISGKAAKAVKAVSIIH